jgi:hypothetical protein
MTGDELRVLYNDNICIFMPEKYLMALKVMKHKNLFSKNSFSSLKGFSNNSNTIKMGKNPFNWHSIAHQDLCDKNQFR